MKRTVIFLMICLITAGLWGCRQDSPESSTAPVHTMPTELVMPNGYRVDLTHATLMEDGTVIVPAARSESGVTGERRYSTNGSVEYISYYDQDNRQVMPDDPGAYLRVCRDTFLNYNLSREVEMGIEHFLVENNQSIFKEMYTYDSLGRLRLTQTCALDGEGKPTYTQHTYDENRNEIKREVCGSDWAAESWTEWTYNNRNKPTKQTLFDKDGTAQSWTVTTYHNTQCTASVSHYKKGDVPVAQTFYDELGRLTEKKEYTDGKLSRQELHQPDGSYEICWYGADGTVTKTETVQP